MRNDTVVTLEEFKAQIMNHIKKASPGVNVTPDKVIVKVKLDEDSEPVDFKALRVTIDM